MTGHDELDVLVIKKNKYSCCISILKIENGWINNSQNFYPDTKENLPVEELLSIFIERFIAKNKDRKEIHFLFNENIRKETLDFLKKLDRPKIKIHKLDRQNQNLLEICNSQAEDALHRSNGFFWIPNSLETLSAFLKIKKINRIEAFDISHTSGKQVSASCVVLNRDGPDKKGYRLMNIKNETNNDYLALSEAIIRRLKNLQKNNLSYPEVILLDGGKGQLNSVLKNIEKNFLENIVLIAISKGPNRKEKYDNLHFNNKSFELKEFKNISKVLQLLRNESHRFALNQHRKRRSKDFLSSRLDDVKGIGPKLKINLLRHFGSEKEILEASFDELKSLPGVGYIKANQIYSFINKK